MVLFLLAYLLGPFKLRPAVLFKCDFIDLSAKIVIDDWLAQSFNVQCKVRSQGYAVGLPRVKDEMLLGFV